MTHLFDEQVSVYVVAVRCRVLLTQPGISSGRYCTVLYCTVLYCTVLYCTVLYSTVLCCAVLCCAVLCRISAMQYSTVLTQLMPDQLRSTQTLKVYGAPLRPQSSQGLFEQHAQQMRRTRLHDCLLCLTHYRMAVAAASLFVGSAA